MGTFTKNIRFQIIGLLAKAGTLTGMLPLEVILGAEESTTVPRDQVIDVKSNFAPPPRGTRPSGHIAAVGVSGPTFPDLGT